MIAGSWKDGTATFDSGHPVRDEALVRVNLAAVLLREHREAAHLSVHTVARWAGLHRQTISDLENGQSWADAVTVHRVAVVLGLDSNLRPDPQGRMGPRVGVTAERRHPLRHRRRCGRAALGGHPTQRTADQLDRQEEL